MFPMSLSGSKRPSFRATERPAFEILPYGDVATRMWTQWALPLATPVMDRAWVEAAIETYCDGAARVIVAGSVARPDGYAILCPGEGPIAALRCMGDSVTFEATPVVARNPAALAALAQGFASLGRAVTFGHYPVADGFPDHLRAAMRARGIVLTRPSSARAWPRLPLAEGWPAIEARTSASRRKRLDQQQRKAGARGPVRIEVLAPRPEEVEALMTTAFEIQGRSWKGAAGTALSKTPRQAAFFRAFGHKAAGLGQLRMCFLHIGEEIAAMQIAMDWQGRFWTLSIGYDAAFSAFSPGALLMRALIRRAAETGFDSFEFCGKEADWTRNWTEEALDVAALRLYPFTPRGLGTLAQDAGRIAIRRLRP